MVRAWGSPVDYGESPQKIGRWGAKRVELDATHDISLKFPTVYTDTFENLFHFDNETFVGHKDSSSVHGQGMGRTWMKDWSGQFYVAKVAGTLGHALSAGLAFKVSVDGTHARIHQATELRFVGGLIHDLWMLDLGHGIGFLWDRRTINKPWTGNRWGNGSHNFLRRKDAKLDFLDFADGSRRVRELVTKHG